MEALVNVRGWVGSSVELRETAKGDVVRFRIATTSRYRRDGEWVDGDTVWLSVSAWRALARNVAASLRKGDPVIVSGRLRTERWNGKDGEVREDKVLDAVSVGHDLTRGRSAFTRVRHDDLGPEREHAGPGMPPEPAGRDERHEPGEDVDEPREDGEEILDEVTGEVRLVAVG